MIKENVKIKDDISFIDEINAIEYITASNFKIDEANEVTYTPEYQMSAEIEAIVLYFVEGVTFENNDIIYQSIMKDKTLSKILQKFYEKDNGSVSQTNIPYVSIMNFVRNNVQKKVDFICQKLIHSNSIESSIVELLNTVRSVISNFDLGAFKEIDYKVVMDALKKISDSDIDINPDGLSKIFKDAIKFDNKTAEIIDDKDKKITELKDYIHNLEHSTQDSSGEING